MKIRALLCVLVLVLAVGCSRTQYRAAVTKAYPNCECTPIGADDVNFIIRKADGSVWEIELTRSGKVACEAQLFPPQTLRL